NIDTGVDYRHALSFSRHTTVDFSVGSSLVNLPEVGTAGSPRGAAVGRESLQYQATGDLGLSHDIGRSWRARIAYKRRISFVEACGDPVLTSALRVSLDGFAWRRVDLRLSGGATIGDAATTQSVRDSLHSYDGAIRVRLGMSSVTALYCEYVYYRYGV